MELIVPNALAPVAVAEQVADEFYKRHRALIVALSTRRINSERWSVRAQGCTPEQGLQLRAAGYVAEPSQALGKALGSFCLSANRADEPVWIADMCCTMIGQDRASMITMGQLDITAQESDALTQAVASLMADDGDGIRIEPLDTGRWRVIGDFPDTDLLPSPESLVGQDLGDWWPTGTHWRGWRRRLNEIQMLWHDHPVNLKRQVQGLAPINSLWLYGGGGVAHRDVPSEQQWINDLVRSSQQGDWSAWLDQWTQVQEQLMSADASSSIIFTGDDQITRLSSASRRWLPSFLRPSPKNHWRTWWLNRN